MYRCNLQLHIIKDKMYIIINGYAQVYVVTSVNDKQKKRKVCKQILDFKSLTILS